MDNEQLLQAISDIIEKKLDKALDQELQPIHDRFDKIGNCLDVLEHKPDRTEKKVDNLRIDVAVGTLRFFI